MPSTRLRILTILAVILALTVVSALEPARVHGQTDPAPTVETNEAHVFRSIIQDDDMFVLVRFELPISSATGTADAWCAQLVDNTGCDSVPANPSFPTNLDRGLANVTFYTDSGATLEQLSPVPRIDHGLAGIYFSPGHGITWGDPDALACTESSNTAFTTFEQDCVTPQWSSAANTEAAQRDSLAITIVDVMRNLQGARTAAFGSLVQDSNPLSDILDGMITNTGRTFAIEALGVIDRIVPEAFQASLRGVLSEGFTPVTSDSQLQQNIDATAAATDLTDNLNNAANHFFGMAGATVTLFGLIIFGIFLGFIALFMTGKPIMGALGLFTPLMWGMWMRAPTVSVMFVIIGLLLTAFGWWVTRRSPG